MNSSPEALLLSYQVAQSVRDLIFHNPGEINIRNIQRLSELLAFDTFTDKIDRIERLTIAGKCVLIDIDFLGNDIDNVHFTIAKTLNNLEMQMDSDDPESVARQFLGNIKDYFSFSGERNSPRDILFNCLTAEGGDLTKFCSSLQFLGLLDRLSILTPNLISAEKLDNSIFNYLKEFQFLLGFFSAAENKLEVGRIIDKLSAFQGNDKKEFSEKLKQTICGIYDVLNGYTNFGQVINNLNGDNIGIFIKYWQDKRLISYEPEIKQSITGDTEDSKICLQNALQQFEKNQNVNKTIEGAKYVKLTCDYHYQNSLPSLYKLARQNSELLSKKQDTNSNSSGLDLENSEFVDYLNYVSSINLPFHELHNLKTLESQCCLSLKFLDHFYFPVATIREYFGSKAIYFEKESQLKSDELTLDSILKSLNGEDFLVFDVNFQIGKVPGLLNINENIKTVLHINYASESPLKKISKINIYDRSVRKKKTSSSSYLLGSNYLEDTLSEAKIDGSTNITRINEKAVLLDEPLMTQDSTIFLNVNSNKNDITMNVVSSADSDANEDSQKGNFYKGVESIFIELRSLSFIYSLLKSMLKGNDIIKPLNEKLSSSEKKFESVSKNNMFLTQNDPKRLQSVSRRRSYSNNNKSSAISKRSSLSQKSDLLKEFLALHKSSNAAENLSLTFERQSRKSNETTDQREVNYILKIITNHNIFPNLLNNKLSKTIQLDIYNGRVRSIYLFVESIGLDINTLNTEDESKFPDIFKKLQKLQEFLMITEDLYYFICLLLKS